MEYFDILNKDGGRSGEVAIKGQKLLKGQYYLGAHAYIHNSNGDFLLQKRSESKSFLPGAWDIHMGHVISGETSKSAIIREINEEVGIKVKDLTFIKRIVWEKYNHIIDIFAVSKDIKITELTLQKSEVIDAKYFSRDEMINIIRNMHYRPKEYREVMEHYVMQLK